MVVNTSASDCLERLVPEMIYYVSRGTLLTLLTHSLSCVHQMVGGAADGGASRAAGANHSSSAVSVHSRHRCRFTVTTITSSVTECFTISLTVAGAGSSYVMQT